MENGETVVLLEIPCAEMEPTRYGSIAHIRVGSNLKPLVGQRDKEMELWRRFDTTPYELRVVYGNITNDEIVMLLDYPKYYDKLDIPIPSSRGKVFDDLQNERFIVKNEAGNWDITNLGALMVAKDLRKFDALARKSVRVIWYKNNDRLIVDTVPVSRNENMAGFMHKCGICEERGSGFDKSSR